MLLEEWKDFVIEDIRRCDRCLGGVELAKGNLAVRRHEGLLINTPHTFKVADIKRILAAQVTRMGCFNFTTGLIILLLLLKGRDLGIR